MNSIIDVTITIILCAMIFVSFIKKAQRTRIRNSFFLLIFVSCYIRSNFPCNDFWLERLFVRKLKIDYMRDSYYNIWWSWLKWVLFLFLFKYCTWIGLPPLTECITKAKTRQKFVNLWVSAITNNHITQIHAFIWFSCVFLGIKKRKR